MTTISIPLSEASLTQLQRLAQQAGQPLDEFLRIRIERLADDARDFDNASEYILRKNAELYRRLA